MMFLLFITATKRRVYPPAFALRDRKSTRLNSSHDQISYAVFCLKKKKKAQVTDHLAEGISTDRYARSVNHRPLPATRPTLGSICGAAETDLDLTALGTRQRAQR